MTNAHIFRANAFQTNRLLRATMPKTGVIDVTHIPDLPRIPTTGRTWAAGQITTSKAVRRGN